MGLCIETWARQTKHADGITWFLSKLQPETRVDPLAESYLRSHEEAEARAETAEARDREEAAARGRAEARAAELEASLRRLRGE